MKNKVNIFREAVKEHKKDLAEAGYLLATINSWIYTKRLPRYDTAKELSPIIGLHIKQIPYFYIERG